MPLRRAALAALLLTGVLAAVEPLPARAAQSIITTVAGGPGVGRATGLAQYPGGLTAAGNLLYISSDATTIWVDTPIIRALDLTTGIERVAAGSGWRGFSGDGGPATSARILPPAGSGVDAAGRLYLADIENHRIRMVDEAGVIRTVAGGGRGQYVESDGWIATEAFLNFPSDVVIDGRGDLYIAESYAHRIRRVDAVTGIISTVAGSMDTGGLSGDGGPAKDALLKYPGDLMLDANGNLTFIDSGNHRVRRIDTTTGMITTIAGGGTLPLGSDTPATAVALQPRGMAFGPDGVLHLTAANRVWRLDASGVLHLEGGNGTETVLTSNGTASPGPRARLRSPRPCGRAPSPSTPTTTST